MKLLLVACLCGVFYFYTAHRMEAQYNAGYRAGVANALDTNPPSEELELVCAGLWIGQQNKKWNLRDKNL